LISMDTVRDLSRNIQIKDGGIRIESDDGLRNSSERLSTLGKGLGVSSERGDGNSRSEKKRLDEAETIEFQLSDTDELGGALDVAFDFSKARGSGQVALEFFEDGDLVDSVLLDVENKSVAYDLAGDAIYDTVSIGVTDNLKLEIERASFTRLLEEENDVLIT